jgi:Protein of unknown function (DUF3551)
LPAAFGAVSTWINLGVARFHWIRSEQERPIMRKNILPFCLLTAAALLAAPKASHAQAAVYSYPWCAVYTGPGGPAGSRSCYYTSYQQCMTTILAQGGYCIRSPYYRPNYGRPRR